MKEITNVLVVDDDSGIGEMLKTLLEFNGYKVWVTELPDETEKLILENNIRLVLLDMLISGVNGTEVCARLKSNDSTVNIPVIMMSALHEAGAKCRDAGADDFLAKPFDMEDLLGKIREIN